MAETVLETRGVSMHFGGVIAVDDIDFRLGARELRCLIGPNGAGKSTFFKCLTGLLRPTEGQIFMRGHETTDWHTHEIAALGVGIKTQVPNVMDGLTVHENIWIAGRRFHAPADTDHRVGDIIDRLALGPIARRQLGQLAHGERQRVELAMVAIGDPWLILLDEPAAGMAASDMERMTELISEMTATTAVVVVEHDMQFIRSIASTVTVFHNGRVLMEDHVDRVMADATVRDVYLGRTS